MDSSSSVEFIDAVKAGKAKASLWYRRVSQIKVLMYASEVCLAVFILLTLCSSGGFSLMVESAIDCFLRLFDLFRSPPTMFLLINMIIVAIALMSGTNSDTKSEASPVTDINNRIYDEYVGYVSRQANVQVSEVHPRDPETFPTNNLQIVPYVVNQPKPSQPVECTKSNVSKVHFSPNSVKADAKARSKKEDKRTNSTLEGKECWEEIINNRVLRRSMTENGRGTMRRLVDDLSNEEFNQKVESFIARRRCFLQRELIADMTIGVVPMESHINISNDLAVIVGN